MTRRFMMATMAVPAGFALLARCGTDHKTPAASHLVKIKVNRDGQIVMNDEPATLEQVKSSLSKLTQSGNGAVWYYRENAGAEPHANAMLVLQAIVDAKLPVRLSTKPDFSDTAGPDGAPQP